MILIQPPALEQDLAIPLKAKGFEGPQDRVGGARQCPWLVDVLDAQEPFAGIGAGVKVTTDCRHQRTEVEWAGR
jgi:hypothetical protein